MSFQRVKVGQLVVQPIYRMAELLVRPGHLSRRTKIERLPRRATRRGSRRARHRETTRKSDYPTGVGYVDIHSHVLYGMDDGAKTLEDSLAMLQLAASDGTSDIVATPHASGQYTFNPELLDQRIAEIGAR